MWHSRPRLCDPRNRDVPRGGGPGNVLAGEARSAVGRAAALYEKEAALLARSYDKKDVFIGPWTGKKFEDWTPAVRAREREILGEALGLEAKAVAEFEKALAAEGVKALAAEGRVP